MHRIVRFAKDISQYFYEKTVYKRHYDKYVFMFHVVADNRMEWYEQDYSISMDGFVEFVERLKEKGFQFVTPEEFMRGKKSKCVLLTFDDAFACIYHNVFQYLKDQEIPFTVFQTYTLLGQEKYLNENMIREMLTFSGFTLGGHAWEHVRLSELKRQESLNAVLTSKQKLEELFRIEILSMAYPYGSSSAVALKDRINVKKAGYECAFSTINSGISKTKNRKYFLPRINVNEENYLSIIERI